MITGNVVKPSMAVYKVLYRGMYDYLREVRLNVSKEYKAQEVKTLNGDIALLVEKKSYFEQYNEQAINKIHKKYFDQQYFYTRQQINDNVKTFFNEGAEVKDVVFNNDNVESNRDFLYAIMGLFFIKAEEKLNKGVSFSSAVREAFGIAKRRAKNVSLWVNREDTKNGLFSTLKEKGVTKYIWTYTYRSKKERLTHKNILNGQVFDIDEGLYDPDVDRNILPAELIGCRCAMTPVIE